MHFVKILGSYAFSSLCVHAVPTDITIHLSSTESFENPTLDAVIEYSNSQSDQQQALDLPESTAGIIVNHDASFENEVAETEWTFDYFQGEVCEGKHLKTKWRGPKTCERTVIQASCYKHQQIPLPNGVWPYTVCLYKGLACTGERGEAVDVVGDHCWADLIFFKSWRVIRHGQNC